MAAALHSLQVGMQALAPLQHKVWRSRAKPGLGGQLQAIHGHVELPAQSAVQGLKLPEAPHD